MPPQRDSTEHPSLVREWVAEWPKILASLTVSLIAFLAATTSKDVREWIWPPIPPYPVICTAEPVYLKGDQRKVEIYLINTSAKDSFSEEDLRKKLRDFLGNGAGNASPIVTFRYQDDVPHAQSALADTEFNKGKGELAVSLQPDGVRIEPRQIDQRAILRANVFFTVANNDVEFERGAKGMYAMFNLEGPESECFTR